MAETIGGGGFMTIRIDNPILRGLKNFPKKVQDEIVRVVRETSDTLFQRIKDDTPQDRGSGGGAVSKWTRRVETTGSSVQVVIRNDAPYINVLEFGGFPVVPLSRNPQGTGGFIRGKALLGAYPPGPRTAIAPGGSPIMVSNVATGGVKPTRGMARKNLEGIAGKFNVDLEEAIEAAFEDLT